MGLNLGWRIKDALAAERGEVQGSRVDCGTCPVNIQCVTADGGNGWKFDCCGSAAIEVADGDGRVLLVMDCAQNRFTQRENASEIRMCPLCSGDIVKSDLLGMGDHHRYVPTVHAAVSVPARLQTWKKTRPAALDLAKRIKERSKKT
jgi:hypothetical protein